MKSTYGTYICYVLLYTYAYAGNNPINYVDPSGYAKSTCPGKENIYNNSDHDIYWSSRIVNDASMAHLQIHPNAGKVGWYAQVTCSAKEKNSETNDKISRVKKEIKEGNKRSQRVS